jgi:hypothetical protein
VSDGTPGNLERELLNHIGHSEPAEEESDHGHLVDLDRAFVKVVSLNERTEKRVERCEVMLELICKKLDLVVPERVR